MSHTSTVMELEDAGPSLRLDVQAVVRRVEADIRATTTRITPPSFFELEQSSKLPTTLRDADVVTDGARTAEPSCRKSQI
ncbi:hypothetical protein DY000_02043022 [Brassica cretica]|uniref:Uncharacterized protein n=1 Tax=Brassica cretica TaxID=69181 RepID=A0ABQ7BNY0_BRACR|nr:hypothetical protein DY000_02043022 [Brassica cretica]